MERNDRADKKTIYDEKARHRKQVGTNIIIRCEQRMGAMRKKKEDGKKKKEKKKKKTTT